MSDECVRARKVAMAERGISPRIDPILTAPDIGQTFPFDGMEMSVVGSARSRHSFRASKVLVVAAALVARDVDAQCADGTPPPCAAAKPVRKPAAASKPASAVPAGAGPLAVVRAMRAVGGDASLERLGATLSAIVATNLTVGDMRAVAASATQPVTGASVEVSGSVLQLGPRVRATVELHQLPGGALIKATTYESTTDSLLSIADAASVDLLRAWWGARRDAHFHGGLTTNSLAAIRPYIAGILAWSAGDTAWRTLLDSAARADTTFAMPIVWLSLPPATVPRARQGFITGFARPAPRPDRVARLRGALAGGALDPTTRSLVVSGLHVAAAGVGTPIDSSALSALALNGSERTVEQRYVTALILREMALTGLPDSIAIRGARQVLAFDSTFVPGRRLLFAELVDQGDTTQARAVLAGTVLPDTSERRWLREILETRTSSARELFDAYGLRNIGDRIARLLRYGRYTPAMVFIQRVESDALAAFEAGIATIRGNPENVTLATRVATLCECDSTGKSSRPLVDRLVMGGLSSVLLPIDTATLELRPTIIAIDTAIGRLGLVVSQIISSPGSFAAGYSRDSLVTEVRWSVAQVAFFAGRLALARGDLPVVARSERVLDSLALLDSVAFRPVSLVLRALEAGKADRHDEAYAFADTALRTSVFTTPTAGRWLLAQELARQGNLEAAARLAHAITASSELAPLDAIPYIIPALRLEAELAERRRQPAVARALYQRIVELRPQPSGTEARATADVHLHLAALLQQSGDAAGAATHRRIAQQLSPPSP